MANQRQIKRRISAAKNISQITKAMEMVSASKMKKAQEQALSARPYTKALQKSLQKVSHGLDTSIHPLLQTHLNGQKTLLLISTDKGLVGGLNNHLFKAAYTWIRENPKGLVIPIGKKAVQFCRLAGATIHAQFTELPEKITTNDIAPITTLLTNGFLEKSFRSVEVIYMDFINTLSQKERTIQLLPLQSLSSEEAAPEETSLNSTINQDYIFEPSAKEILGDLLPYYIENTLYQAFLEAKASEHSSRMVTMKNASENAGDLMKELKLAYNKTRQANITSELLDITTASLTVN